MKACLSSNNEYLMAVYRGRSMKRRFEISVEQISTKIRNVMMYVIFSYDFTSCQNHRNMIVVLYNLRLR